MEKKNTVKGTTSVGYESTAVSRHWFACAKQSKKRIESSSIFFTIDGRRKKKEIKEKDKEKKKRKSK